jgi:hypothetical protein
VVREELEVGVSELGLGSEEVASELESDSEVRLVELTFVDDVNELERSSEERLDDVASDDGSSEDKELTSEVVKSDVLEIVVEGNAKSHPVSSKDSNGKASASLPRRVGFFIKSFYHCHFISHHLPSFLQNCHILDNV